MFLQPPPSLSLPVPPSSCPSNPPVILRVPYTPHAHLGVISRTQWSQKTLEKPSLLTLGFIVPMALRLSVCFSFSDSLTLCVLSHTSCILFPFPSSLSFLHSFLCQLKNLNSLTAGTHAALIKDGDSESETWKRWSRGECRGRWSEGTFS